MRIFYFMKLIATKIDSFGGVVTPPSSKSHSIRGLLLAVLANGDSRLINILESDDTTCAKNVCKLLGATIDEYGENLVVRSAGLPLTGVTKEINTGDSGVTTRFVLPMLGLRKNNNEEIILDCGVQMKKRPLKSLIEALNNLGMNIKSINNDGCCPLLISGELIGGTAEVEGLTSQFVSALLLSLPLAKKDSVISVKNLNERPYLEMTLEWLRGQGTGLTHYRKDEQDIFQIKGGQSYHPFTKQISVDFSSLSYLLASAVLLPGKTILQDIDMQDSQGDKRLVEILMSMGAEVEIKDKELIINGGKDLQGMVIDANDIPDLVPALAVIATQARGQTKIINVPQARSKETDRLSSMTTELKKMGGEIEELRDGLIVKQSNLNGVILHGYNDHRTIMSLAVAGLVAEGQTEIDTAESINKTFPSFVKFMNNLGAKLKII